MYGAAAKAKQPTMTSGRTIGTRLVFFSIKSSELPYEYGIEVAQVAGMGGAVWQMYVLLSYFQVVLVL